MTGGAFPRGAMRRRTASPNTGSCSSKQQIMWINFPGSPEDTQRGTRSVCDKDKTPSPVLAGVSSHQATPFFLLKREGTQVGDGRDHEF